MEVDSIQPISSKRFSIVDCGTNTFNLLVVDIIGDSWELVFSNKIPVKIGIGGFEDRRIQPGRMARALDVLKHYQEISQLYQVHQTRVVATSAIRDALNQQDLIDKVKEWTGWEMEVISGDEEAQLIYEGVRMSGPIGMDRSLIMDIGGGSTEWIIANENQVFWKKSYPLGVSRLFERIQPSDRLTNDNIASLRKVLDTELVDLKQALERYPCVQLIGASGSFDTLLDIFYTSSGEKHAHRGHQQEIPLSAFPAIHLWLMGSTLNERLKHPAIPGIRAEYMPLSSLMVKYILEISKCRKMFRSEFALKEGLLQRVISDLSYLR